MATIKSYTDLEQSKKLAEILPLESADMNYSTWTILDGEFIVSPNQGSTIESLQEDYGNQIIPCWSLAALLGLIPNYKLSSEHNYHTCIAETSFGKETVAWFDNPVDACYELILKLHELKML